MKKEIFWICAGTGEREKIVLDFDNIILSNCSFFEANGNLNLSFEINDLRFSAYKINDNNTSINNLRFYDQFNTSYANEEKIIILEKILKKYEEYEKPFEAKNRNYYYFTNGNGIALYRPDKRSIHLGCINDYIDIPEGRIYQTNITEYKHSGKHQYFLWDDEKKDLYKINGHDYKNRF
jgi:hypothetical protein